MTIYTSLYGDLPVPNVTLSSLAFRHAGRLATKPAFIDGGTGRTLSYGRLAALSHGAAVGLSAGGFGRGSVLCLFAPNLPEYAAVFHAALLAGGTVTTANPLGSSEDLAKQLADSGASVLVTVPPLLEVAQAAATTVGAVSVYVLGEADGAESFAALAARGAATAEAELPAINPATDLAALPYSSGTTGLPKGVMLTHANLVANLLQMEAVDSTSENDVLLGVLPLFHIYGMTAIANAALHRGATVVTLPRFEIEGFLRAIQDHRVTRAYVAPPLVLLLAKHPLVDRFDLSSLKVITSAAAPLSAELAVLCARRLGCVVTQGYGLTETSPAVFVDGDRADTVTPGTVGSLVPGTLARLVLEDGTDAPRGGPGELWLKGPQVMSGYLNRPDETAAAFADGGWLRTGDIATVDGAGRFAIADRVKELIKHKGFQVAPSEIEGVLLSHPAVADCAVVPSPDDESGEVPKAFVVRKGEVTAEELIDFVAERVTSYKRVRDVQFVDVIPRSAAGKVLRRELVERERTDRAAERSRVRRLHDRVTVERHGEHVLLIGLDRQNKMNAFDPEMFWGLAEALTEYDDDPTLRCAVLFGHGRAFTSGLDLATSAPLAARGELTTLEGQVNPWGLSGGRLQTKPVIGAVHGRCWTLGIELLANLDIRLAAEGTRFAQLEVSRGLFPFGGATVRLPALTGWGNAMRWMLTGDEFDAVEAHRIGLVQEVVPAAELMARAIALADKVAAQAPLGVQATIASSRLAASQGEEAALARLSPEIQRLMASEDFREGVESFFARRPAAYTGR